MWPESNAPATYPPPCPIARSSSTPTSGITDPHTCWNIVTIGAICSAVSRSLISSVSSFISPDRTRCTERRSGPVMAESAANGYGMVYGMYKVVGADGARR